MSDVWAVIVGVILLMIMYGYISSKIEERKRAKIRQDSVPEVSESIIKGVMYDVHLSDGRKFEGVQIIGNVEGSDDAFSFASYEGMLILLQANGKKVFLKKTAIRFIVEA